MSCPGLRPGGLSARTRCARPVHPLPCALPHQPALRSRRPCAPRRAAQSPPAVAAEVCARALTARRPGADGEVDEGRALAGAAEPQCALALRGPKIFAPAARSISNLALSGQPAAF